MQGNLSVWLEVLSVESGQYSYVVLRGGAATDDTILLIYHLNEITSSQVY